MGTTGEVEVIVVGTGAAGLAAALSAHRAGASVQILEKAAVCGGTTAKSLGAHWIPNNRFMRGKGILDCRPDAVRYMARVAYPSLYDSEAPSFGLPKNDLRLIEAYYDRGDEATRNLMKMGALESFPVFDFPDFYAHLPEDKAPHHGRLLLPTAPHKIAERAGGRLVGKLKEATIKHGIPILYNQRVDRLRMNSRGQIIGVGAGSSDFLARKAVIFCTGGFAHTPELIRQNLNVPIHGVCAVAASQGDFISIAQTARAKMNNMRGAWWTEIALEAAISDPEFNYIGFIPGDSSIVVNRHGNRVYNEKTLGHERTLVHFQQVDGPEYPNRLLFLIYDQRTADIFGRRTAVLGNPYPIPHPDAAADYVIKGWTLRDLRSMITDRLKLLDRHTEGFDLASDFESNLSDTVARFGLFASTGIDSDFHRGETEIECFNHGPCATDNLGPNPTMHPFGSDGPYYAIILAPGILDTNGGPKINELGQILDIDDLPIPGLYGAGNCISCPAGEGYWGGGTSIGLALVFGYIAGEQASREPIKVLQ